MSGGTAGIQKYVNNVSDYIKDEQMYNWFISHVQNAEVKVALEKSKVFKSLANV